MVSKNALHIRSACPDDSRSMVIESERESLLETHSSAEKRCPTVEQKKHKKLRGTFSVTTPQSGKKRGNRKA